MKISGAMVLALSLGTAPAWAVLGQPAQSVQSDQARMKGQIEQLSPANAGGQYTVQQITAADGGVVREYISPSGIVFGVAWSGHAAPDLSQLLGGYAAPLQQAMQSRVQRRGPLVVRTGNLVVAFGGHMRALTGIAYVTTLVPAAVPASVVQ